MNINSNILYFLQDTCRNIEGIQNEITACENINRPWETFGYVYFSNAISCSEKLLEQFHNELTPTKLIVRSGTKILRLLEDDTSDIHPLLRKKMCDGVWHSKYFDQQYMKGTPVENHMLNAGAEFMKYSDAKNIMFPEVFFIKPSGDLKEFAGGFLKPNTTIENYIKNTWHDNNVDSATIMISNNIHDIKAEARFMVVNGIVSSGSYYKIKDKLISKRILPNTGLFNYVQKLIRDFAPAEIYTIDVAIVENMEIKIVEYNCFNASGLYDIHTEKVFEDIAKYLEKKYN